MRWQRLRRSSNVDDVRGRRAGRRAGMPLRLGGGRGSLVVVAVLVIAYFVGGPDAVNLLLEGGAPATDTTGGSAVDDGANDFLRAVLGSTEDEWSQIFAASGETYAPPRLTRFNDAIQSACGYSSAAVGPFYCPGDRRVYIDVSFFDDLARMGGPGEFAQAYVVGHEVGHHVQTLLGTSNQVRNAQRGASEAAANRLQVSMELQADCYAGVWAFHANRRVALLEPGDVDSALAAAAAIGDDRLQRNAGRRVTPDSFTHGSSADRQQWLRRGLESGDPSACDTFQ
jgi:uncharacterized protein